MALLLFRGWGTNIAPVMLATEKDAGKPLGFR